MGSFIDLTGMKFGRLTVVERVQSKGNTKWKCACECNNETFVYSDHLKRGKVVSCGCKRNERKVEVRKQEIPEYNSWRAMLDRCNNSNNDKYNHYGGRGITVCEEWRSFDRFYLDMGKKPSKTYTIDRIDTEGNYEPSNCKWSTVNEQVRNRRILRNNTSGASGVMWNKQNNKWAVVITVDNKKIHLGYFADFNDALQARKEAELTHWKESS